MALISTKTPSLIVAGDTAKWQLSLSDYPAPTWVVSYALVVNGIRIAFTALASGTDHLIEIAKATTATWKAGLYSYQAYATSSTERVIIETGSIRIATDFAQATTGYDDRSWAKRCLDNVEAVIEGRASQAQLEYTIAGRQLKFITPKELFDMRDRFRLEYFAEEAKKQQKKTGKSRFGSVQVRFT